MYGVSIAKRGLYMPAIYGKIVLKTALISTASGKLKVGTIG
jgi:hypothetical protein